MFATKSSYREAWERAGQEDPAVPLNVDLELASLCNLRCPFCFIPDPNFDAHIKTKAADGKPKARMMPKEMAFRIIDQAAELGVPALKFNWRGESTLHPDYSEIVRYAASRPRQRDIGNGLVVKYIGPCTFHDLLVNTNANCSDAAIDGLMAATKVMVSLDSLMPATYAVMRRGGNLERAKVVIHELIRRGHPNLWIRRVLAEDNKHEPFFEMVRATFGDKVKVSEHFCFDRNATESHENVGCDHDHEMERTYCGYPSQRLVIASTGLVYPCCLDLHETIPVGDINKQTLFEIWNGEPIKKLRATLRANDIKNAPASCQNCESWMAYKRPERNYVQDVEVRA